jgi:hypothetical protein
MIKRFYQSFLLSCFVIGINAIIRIETVTMVKLTVLFLIIFPIAYLFRLLGDWIERKLK